MTVRTTIGPSFRATLGQRLRDLRLRLGPNSFARHALAISSGVAFAQAIQVLTTPVLTRLFSPAEYGLAASLGSVAAIVTAVSTLRFESGIPIAHTRKETHRLATLSLACVLLVSLATALLLAAAPDAIARACGLPPAGRPWLWMLPLLVLTGGGQWVLQQTATAARAYRALGTSTAAQSLAGTTFKIAAGALRPTAGVLLLGELLRRCLGTFTLARASGFGLRTFARHARWKTLAATARRHRRYPLYTLGAGLLNIISLQAPVLLLAAAYSPKTSGHFALGLACVQVPLSLVTAGVSNAFAARLRGKERDGQLVPFVETFFQAMSLLGAPAIAIAIAWGPELVTTAFGAAWRPCGTYLAFLGPWLFLTLTNPGASTLLNLRNRQSSELPWQVVFLVTRIGGLYTACRLASETVAIATFGALSFVVFGLYAAWVFRLLGIRLRPTLAFGLRELALYTVPSLAVALPARHLHLAGPAIILPAILLVALVGLRRAWTHRAFGLVGLSR